MYIIITLLQCATIIYHYYLLLTIIYISVSGCPFFLGSERDSLGEPYRGHSGCHYQDAPCTEHVGKTYSIHGSMEHLGFVCWNMLKSIILDRSLPPKLTHPASYVANVAPCRGKLRHCSSAFASANSEFEATKERRHDQAGTVRG